VINSIAEVLNTPDLEDATYFTDTEKQVERRFIKECPQTEEGLWRLIERKSALEKQLEERIEEEAMCTANRPTND